MEVLDDNVEDEDDGGVVAIIAGNGGGGGGSDGGGVVAVGAAVVVVIISEVDISFEGADLGVLAPEIEEPTTGLFVADGDLRSAGDLEGSVFTEVRSSALQFVGTDSIRLTLIFTITGRLKQELLSKLKRVFSCFGEYLEQIFLSTAASDGDCEQGTGSTLTALKFSAGWDGSGDNLGFLCGDEESKLRLMQMGNDTFRLGFLSTDENVGDTDFGVDVGVKFSFGILVLGQS